MVVLVSRYNLSDREIRIGCFRMVFAGVALADMPHSRLGLVSKHKLMKWNWNLMFCINHSASGQHSFSDLQYKKQVLHHYAKINEVNSRYAFSYLFHLHIICWCQLPPTYKCAYRCIFCNFPPRAGLERNCFKNVWKYDCREKKINKQQTYFLCLSCAVKNCPVWQKSPMFFQAQRFYTCRFLDFKILSLS